LNLIKEKTMEKDVYEKIIQAIDESVVCLERPERGVYDKFQILLSILTTIRGIAVGAMEQKKTAPRDEGQE
jgi:hypothetical protein